MNYLNQTIACAKRNNGLILLFLGVIFITWFEVLSYEKALLPQLVSSPMLQGLSVDDIEMELHGRRFIHYLLLLSFYLFGIIADAFLLYIGQYYMNALNNKRFVSWFKIAVYVEIVNVIYKIYMVIVRYLDLDLLTWNIQDRFSLLRLLKVSSPGIITDLFSPILASINVISIMFFFLLVILISRKFKEKFWVSFKYAMCTLVLSSAVIMCLASLIKYVNA